MGTVTCPADKVPPMPVWRGVQKEAIIIRQILGGRQDLLEHLIEPHLDPLWRTVKARVRDDADTDDIVQEALFKALIHLCTHSQNARLVQLALASLPEKYRVVVRMRDLEERPIIEVAEQLRLTAAAVKTRQHRGRLRMAEFLSRASKPTRFKRQIGFTGLSRPSAGNRSPSALTAA